MYRRQRPVEVARDGDGGTAVEDDDAEPQRSPLLDPRLAGAGGMLIAAAALAWFLTHGMHGSAPDDPSPSTSVTSASQTTQQR